MQLRLVSGYRIFEVLKERVFQNDIDSIELKLKQIEVLSIRHFYLWCEGENIFVYRFCIG
jgi:hypothetical protein